MTKQMGLFRQPAKTIRSIGEDGLISGIANSYSRSNTRLIKAIGDDTSVTVQNSGLVLLATTDILIEGVHFIRELTTPYLLGRKSLSVSLSDIAAMGGNPLFHLVSIALPADTPTVFINGLYKGINAVGLACGSSLAGGNTARQPDRIMISITAFGEALKDRVVYRGGAKKGDIIYVSGCLGDSALGLTLLQKHGASALRGKYKKAIRKHLDPLPRLALGKALASGKLASAMMDLSDGLGIDLERLCKASGVSARIELEKIPVSNELEHYAEDTVTSAQTFALSGGEDYELLFTSSSRNAKKIEALARDVGTLITPIGLINEKLKGRQKVILIKKDGTTTDLKERGFQHF